MKVLFLCLAVVALTSACIQPEICTVDCPPCPATRPLASCLGTMCKCKVDFCRIQVGLTIYQYVRIILEIFPLNH